jgi:general secretion pathway protein L
VSAPSAVPSAVSRQQAGARIARLRPVLDAAVHLFGFAEPRADRSPAGLTLRLGVPGETAVALIDRRQGEARTYRLDIGTGDPAELAERIAGIAGGRGGVRVKVLVDPAACFLRSLDLPSAALPRMRALLAEALEAATPFRAASVYSDWFVEGEDAAARTLRVRHVVIKRARLDPLLDALARAGLPVGPVAVGRSEEQTMPLDLLSHGHRSLQALVPGARRGDVLLLAGAALLVVAAFWGWRAHQDATLAALDDAFAATRRTAGPSLPPPVQAGLSTILAGRAPPLARTWDALAAALPLGTSATALHCDAAGARVTLATRSEAEAMAALARVPGFGPPVLRSAADGPEGARTLVVLLPGDRP